MGHNIAAWLGAGQELVTTWELKWQLATESLNLILAVCLITQTGIFWFSARFARGLLKVSRPAPAVLASFDQISRQVRDRDLLQVFDRFRGIRKKFGNNLSYALVISTGAESGHNELGHFVRSDRDCLIHILNYYESWAIGINHGALSVAMLENWWRSTLVGDFIDLYPFVYGYRKETGVVGAFDQTERLVTERWADSKELQELAMARAAARKAYRPSGQALPAAPAKLRNALATNLTRRSIA